MNDGGERLPWLSDEPVLASAGRGQGRTPGDAEALARPPVGSRSMWPFYLLLLLLIGAVGVGAWWLGTRQKEARAPQLPIEEPVAVPVPPVATAPVEVPPPEPVPEPVAETVTSARPPALVRTAPPAPVRTAERSRAAAPTRPESEGRSVFPADEPVTAPLPVTGPQPVVVYHPQTNRGRVIQLGAYPNRTQAEQAWRKVTRRYPYLSTKPRMINTVDVRGLGSARRTRMYRLQLGTSSQAQSAVICQQLERAGQSCVVVY
ncbi:hypothetical protein GCM10022280_24180 [Sphingomonas swuensis]|uniref:SPOR domain-containing protein n=1 Tax=Sphingomonas swuensis TaxID=977800 RepID=A0ABP7T918_9SPHN